MARSTNKALANLQMLELLEKNTSQVNIDNYLNQSAPSININGGRGTRTADKSQEQDLAGQEAMIDRKIEQSGRNALTKSRAWDVLGDVIGFNTQTDYLDAKAGIDAEQAMVAKQAREAAEQAAIKELALEQARISYADQDVKAFTDQALNVKPATEEDKTIIANFILDREVATDMIRSKDPEIQKKGHERLTANDLAWKAYQQKNEEQAIQKGQWGAEQKVREGQLAETRRNNIATLNETRRSHQEIERLNREQLTATKENAVRKDFYDSTGSQHQLVQGVLNDIYVGLKEATQNNNPAALNAVQKKIAKLTDPTTGVLQGEMRDMVSSGFGDKLVRAWERGRGTISQQDAEDLYNAARAIEESERQMYERSLRLAEERARLSGVNPEVLAPYEYKPLESAATAVAPRDKKDKFKPGDVVSGGAEVLLEGARAVGGVVGTVFGN